MNDGLTTIENVIKEYDQSYDGCSIMTQIELKCWRNHSESRHANGNKPFTFGNYISHMNPKMYIEQVSLNMIDCDDIGGKERVVAFLERYL